MSELLRIGGLARLDEREPEHVREFASSACERMSIEPDEIASLLAEYEDGRWRLVRLDLFADVVGPEGGLRRVDSVHVDGVWFTAPHGRDNLRHAQEATDQSLERLHDHLAQIGAEVSLEQLERAEFTLELDDAVRRALDA